MSAKEELKYISSDQITMLTSVIVRLSHAFFRAPFSKYLLSLHFNSPFLVHFQCIHVNEEVKRRQVFQKRRHVNASQIRSRYKLVIQLLWHVYGLQVCNLYIHNSTCTKSTLYTLHPPPCTSLIHHYKPWYNYSTKVHVTLMCDMDHHDKKLLTKMVCNVVIPQH